MATRRSRSTDVAIIVDNTTSSTFVYIGKAEKGSLTSDPVWEITRIDKTNGALFEYGTNNPAEIWDNRATTVVYSI